MLNPRRQVKQIGPQYPVYIVGEIGINHNGDLTNVTKLMIEAKRAGFDAVKLQKRTPELCVPKDQWYIPKDTPWGMMPYIDYRERMEFDKQEWHQLFSEAKHIGIDLFASVWDLPSLEFMEDFTPDCRFMKVPSAKLTDDELLEGVRAWPTILSTGMSTWEEIKHAVDREWPAGLIIMHCTSTYPCPLDELNLKMVDTMQNIAMLQEFPIGYSGHEVGLATTIAAVALGASIVERHITLDRTMWGSDQAASVEPTGMWRLVKDIRAVEKALGDGKKVVYPSEQAAKIKLRGS